MSKRSKKTRNKKPILSNENQATPTAIDASNQLGQEVKSVIPQETTRLQNLIEAQLKQNGRYLFPKETRNSSFKTGKILQFVLGLFFVVSLTSLLIQTIRSDFDLYALVSIVLLLVALLALINYFRIATLIGPTTPLEWDRWRLRQSRNRIFSLLIVFITVFIRFYFGSPFADETDTRRMLRSLMLLGSAIVIFSGFLVFLRPRWFASRFLDGIVSVAANASLFFGGASIVELYRPGSFSIFIFFLGLAVSVRATNRVNKLNNDGLSYFQREVLALIGPVRIFDSLRTLSQKLSDQYEAIAVHSRIAKELPLGVRSELIKLYAQEHRAENRIFWILGIVVSIIVFVLHTIGESAINDIFYTPILKPFLCEFGLRGVC